MRSDHYQALGVHPLATRAEIRAAYLRLMRAHHPDVRPHDPASAATAQRANAAWEVLGNHARRAAYDRLAGAGRDGVRPGVRRVPAPPHRREPPAYSPESARYRRAFHVACVKVASAVLVVGLALLFAVA